MIDKSLTHANVKFLKLDLNMLLFPPDAVKMQSVDKRV